MGGAGLAGTIKTQQNHGGMDMSTINSVTAAAYTTTAYESKAAAKKENTEATTEKSYGKDVGVVYEKSSKTVEKISAAGNTGRTSAPD